MPVSEPSNSHVVEADSILFETLMPVQTIQVPQQGQSIPVQFGIRITNQSSMPYRFNLPGFFPEIFDSNGQLVSRGGSSNARRRMTNQDIPLINPGESTTFWTAVDLFCIAKNYFRFSGYIGYGSVWSTTNLQIGTYQLRLTYRSRSSQYNTPLDTGDAYARIEIRDFWVGTVSTSLVNFCLVQN